MKKKLLIAGIAILFVIAILALRTTASLRVYFIRYSPGATVFSRDDEAYLFLGSGGTGYHFTYSEYPFVVFREYFYDVPSPANQRNLATAIHVTPSAIERNVMDFDDHSLKPTAFLTPFDDGFYAMCPGSSLCKWIGGGFAPATEEEQRTNDGLNRLFHGSMNNQTINGWAVHQVLSVPGNHFEVHVDDKFVISAKNLARGVREYDWIAVDLIRSGQPPEKLYEVNGTPHTVSKSEYERWLH
jgi:hypothetical protein